MTLAEALSLYLATGAVELPAAQQELNRFGRTIGFEKDVELVNPPEVAAYAESVVTAGGDVAGRLTSIKGFLGFLKKKGYCTHSLAAHVKIPRANGRAGTPQSRAPSDAISMTAEGLVGLQQELQELKGQRADVAEAIRDAAADKDFRENAPLDAAREHQGKMEARIRELEETVRRAVVIDTTRRGGRGVRLGAKVMLMDLTSQKEIGYLLVDSAEADPLAGKISIASPVGKAIVGRNKGDEVVVQAPRGERRYKISSVEY